MKTKGEKIMQSYRQGDVLVVKVESIPTEAKARDWSKEGRVILAYGEVTGHAHALKIDLAQEFRTKSQRFVSLKEGAQLSHEEHATICFPAGDYEIIQQREYTPEAIRNVVD